MDILDKLSHGEPARLIPILAEGKKEERATSALLATMAIIPTFAEKLLSSLNVSFGKRSKIECFTEVRFADYDEFRPDGLIVIRTGKKVWSAIVESKVGNAKLDQTQFDNYASLAKKVGVDALITFSNQYAVKSDHHPLAIPKRTLKFIQVGHISWLAVKSETMLLCANRGIDDPEQAFILAEFLRFLSHEASGISTNISLSKQWGELIDHVQSRLGLSGKESMLISAISDLQQLSKFISLELAMSIERPVSIAMSSKRLKDPDLNFKEDLSTLRANKVFTFAYDVFGCDSQMIVTLDLAKKSLEIETERLPILEGRGSRGIVGAIVKRIKEVPDLDPIFKFYWPRSKKVYLDFCLSDFYNLKGKVNYPERAKKEPPSSYSVSAVIDLGNNLKRPKPLLNLLSGAVNSFYESVLLATKIQKLESNPANRPKSKETKSGTEDTSHQENIEKPSLEKPKSPNVFFRILPIRETRYLDDRYN